jgi:hypothetical protein
MKAILLLLAAGFLHPALATPLARGGSVSLAGVTALSHPQFTGTVLADKAIPFEIRQSNNEVILTGIYRSRVIRSAITGKLVIEGRISDTANPPGTVGWITHAALNGLGFVDTDVETRTDALGSTPATNATRNVVGDRVTFRIGPGLLDPPSESRPFMALTTAVDFSNTGTVTIFGSNDFGGNAFFTTIDGTYAPLPPPLTLAIGDRFFFETLYYHPITVTGAAVGVRLRVQTSPDLTPGSWITQAGLGVPATAGSSTVFGEVNPGYGGRQFFRVFCELPGG